MGWTGAGDGKRRGGVDARLMMGRRRRREREIENEGARRKGAGDNAERKKEGRMGACMHCTSTREPPPSSAGGFEKCALNF